MSLLDKKLNVVGGQEGLEHFLSLRLDGVHGGHNSVMRPFCESVERF